MIFDLGRNQVKVIYWPWKNTTATVFYMSIYSHKSQLLCIVRHSPTNGVLCTHWVYILIWDNLFWFLGSQLHSVGGRELRSFINSSLSWFLTRVGSSFHSSGTTLHTMSYIGIPSQVKKPKPDIKNIVLTVNYVILLYFTAGCL